MPRRRENGGGALRLDCHATIMLWRVGRITSIAVFSGGCPILSRRAGGRSVYFGSEGEPLLGFEPAEHFRSATASTGYSGIWWGGSGETAAPCARGRKNGGCGLTAYDPIVA